MAPLMNGHTADPSDPSAPRAPSTGTAPRVGPPLTELLRGASLRGGVKALDVVASTRLGRALGTLVRRRGPSAAVDEAHPSRARVVVARSDDGPALPVRDGLVRGLVLAGHDVKDIGAVGSDVFTFALRHLDAVAGIVVAVEGTGEAAMVSLVFFVGGRPLVGEGLSSLVQIAEAGEYAAGEGRLDILDVRAAFRSAPAPGAAGDADDNTDGGVDIDVTSMDDAEAP